MLTPEAGGKIQAIALTACARDYDQQQGLQVGYQIHLSKPLNAEKLVTAVVKLVATGVQYSVLWLDNLFLSSKIAMRTRIENNVLFLHNEDLPKFKKGGSVVRNSYFWALRSIAGRSRRYNDWEYESDVWLALERMLMSFTKSGYLVYRETVLEFPLSQGEIPHVLRYKEKN
jgi:hypothetical protein